MTGRQPSPLAEAIHQEGTQKLQAALDHLPSQYRAVYLLTTQEEMSAGQIAEVLEISEENVRWRLCKARKKLMFELRSYLDLPQP